MKDVNEKAQCPLRFQLRAAVNKYRVLTTEIQRRHRDHREEKKISNIKAQCTYMFSTLSLCGKIANYFIYLLFAFQLPGMLARNGRPVVLPPGCNRRGSQIAGLNQWWIYAYW